MLLFYVKLSSFQITNIHICLKGETINLITTIELNFTSNLFNIVCVLMSTVK